MCKHGVHICDGVDGAVRGLRRGLCGECYEDMVSELSALRRRVGRLHLACRRLAVVVRGLRRCLRYADSALDRSGKRLIRYRRATVGLARKLRRARRDWNMQTALVNKYAAELRAANRYSAVNGFWQSPV